MIVARRCEFWCLAGNRFAQATKGAFWHAAPSRCTCAYVAFAGGPVWFCAAVDLDAQLCLAVVERNSFTSKATELQPLAVEHDLIAAKIQREKARRLRFKLIRPWPAPWQMCVPAQLCWQNPAACAQWINLDQARINRNALDLCGEALMPNGLRTLNALILSLGQSELFEPNGVKLKATLKRSGSTEAANSGRLNYGMSAAFVPDASKAIRPRLAALGAVGWSGARGACTRRKGCWND